MRRSRSLRLILQALVILLSVAVKASADDGAPRPRWVILYLAEGLGWGQLGLARDYGRLKGKALHLETVLKAGRTGYCSVAPQGALVAESGASAAAFATGRKVPNRALRGAGSGTILELAAKRGLATGLVTDGRLTHATAAAFLTPRERRDEEDAAAQDVAASGVDVMLGGGLRYFPPSLLDKARRRGYWAAEGEPWPPPPGAARLLGLLTEDYFPYAIDRDRGSPPRLAELTRQALERLSRNPRGFVLVVLARLLDEASHNNDAGAVLAEMLELDEAVGAGLAFLSAHGALDQAQLIVASNHDTGGMGLVYRANPLDWGGPRQLQRIAGQKASLRRMLIEAGAGESPPEPGRLRRAVNARLARGVAISPADAEAVAAALSLGPRRSPFSHSPALEALGRALKDAYQVGWVTSTHTASPVPLFGMGAGTEKLSGLVENTRVFEVMREGLEADGYQ